MGRPPLSAEGGAAAKITAKLPRELDSRMRAVTRRRGVSLSAFLRDAAEAELDRLEARPPPDRAA
jgi:hypothetical protein